MSLFRRLFATGNDEPQPSRETPPPKSAAMLPRGGESIDCAGIDWNGVAQLAFVREALARHRSDYEEARRALHIDAMADHAVLFAMIAERRPTRLMEIGSGKTTLVIRQALKRHHLPAELIAVDPQPAADIAEAVDAHLDQPVQELPLSDFLMLRDNEMLILDTTHVHAPGSDVAHLYQRVLPHLNAGVIVGVLGVPLPREYTREQLEKGYSEQALLQMYLTNNARAELLYCGGWMSEHHEEELRGAMGEDDAVKSESIWFRLK